MAADKESQQRSFRAHMDITKRTGKALVIHDREAHDDVMRILEEAGAPVQRGRQARTVKSGAAWWVVPIFLASLAFLIGGSVWAASVAYHRWPFVIMIWGLMLAFSSLGWIFFAVEPARRKGVFGCAGIISVYGTILFLALLSAALDLQGLHDRGITERATITARHMYSTGGAGGRDGCSYSLRAAKGPPIRGELDEGTGKDACSLKIGEQLTVVADPKGLSGPTRDITTFDPDSFWISATVMACVTAIALAVAAWAAVTPPRNRSCSAA